MALAVPLSRFTSPVGGGSAFYVRPRELRNYDTRPEHETVGLCYLRCFRAWFGCVALFSFPFRAIRRGSHRRALGRWHRCFAQVTAASVLVPRRFAYFRIFILRLFDLWYVSQIRGLTSRRSQPPLALAVPLSRFTSRVGGGSAFFVRRHASHQTNKSCSRFYGSDLFVFAFDWSVIPFVVQAHDFTVG